MDRSRQIAVLAVAIGAACMSIALGSLYAAGVRMERAETELLVKQGQLAEWDQIPLLSALELGVEFPIALISGTLGSALIAGGLLFAAFQLPWLRPPQVRAPVPAVPPSTEPA